ncbi:hypothetical protein CSC62_15765 [Pseudoxanthomonas jiangsuensis]|uniref:hypothetical protein n=1 Tax=Pseudoxanthomonas jiangsuensis TaxID=619688 RepID=UPI001390B380|nr:hypothetical protein [Pseudoxanthomonas jiangsuensis]KAF1691560.1 hypothetical protein CSC62_15765 [Pseudoxanthomonas jiangsuensis]
MGRLLLGFYVLLIFVFAIYGNWWGDNAYKGFWFNLGGAVFWPVILFPGLGKVIGGILMVAFVGFLVTRRG